MAFHGLFRGLRWPCDRMAERDDTVRHPFTPPLVPRGSAAILTPHDLPGAAWQVRLTLRLNADGAPLKGDMPPPLELVILSRWPAAAVDWNGEEVIL